MAIWPLCTCAYLDWGGQETAGVDYTFDFDVDGKIVEHCGCDPAAGTGRLQQRQHDVLITPEDGMREIAGISDSRQQAPVAALDSVKMESQVIRY